MISRFDFLRGSGAALVLGLTTNPRWAWGQFRQRAQSSPTAVIVVHANGGWHPRLHVDAGIIEGEDEAEILANVFGEGQTAGQTLVKKIGDFSYRVDQPWLADFYQLGNNLVVFNGIEMPSNDHGVGTEAASVGGLLPKHPSIGALVADMHQKDSPIPFVVSGGNDNTGELVPVATLGAIKDLRRVLLTNRINPDDEALYLPTMAVSFLEAFKVARISYRIEKQRLPRHMETLKRLLDIQEQKLTLAAIADQLTENGDGEDATIGVILDLIELGIVSAVSIGQGNFDTHDGDGQADHGNRLAKLFGFIAKLRQKIIDRDLPDPPLIVCLSEFGRTPGLNNGMGTDHWPQSNSALLLGTGLVPQVMGKSDSGFLAEPVDPETFLPKVGGKKPTVTDLHYLLRELLGVSEELKATFPLPKPGIDVAAVVKRLRGW